MRWFADPGVPVAATRASWRSLAARSVAESRSGKGGPGPVHLNLPFREPLLGDAAAGGGVTPGRGDGGPWHTVVAGRRPPDAAWLRSRMEEGPLRPASRGLIVAGAGCGEPGPILAMAELLGWPVLADPRSRLRRPAPGVIGAADGLLRAERFAGRHLPDCIVRLGERWVSKVVNGFLSRAVGQGAHHLVLDPDGCWADPEREVAELVRADPTLFAAEVARRAAGGDRPDAGPGRSPWVAEWQQAEDRAQAAMDRVLGGPGGDGTLTEPSLARHLYDWLPDPSTLVVSSSMPIRDVESFAGPRERPPRVLSNRGANGIDGVVSTATGVALAGPGPTVALVGDLAFLHDVSALVGPERNDTDLTVVVADNRGGGIFSFLDPASRLEPGTFDTLFATPQAPDAASVAAGLGWPVDDLGPDAGPAGLKEALARRVGAGSRSVIRVQLPGGAANVARHHEVSAAVIDAVDRPAG